MNTGAHQCNHGCRSIPKVEERGGRWVVCCHCSSWRDESPALAIMNWNKFNPVHRFMSEARKAVLRKVRQEEKR